MTTLARWQASITDDAGNVIPGASIEVRSMTIGGSPLVSLYSDRAGATAIGNPFTADSNGFAAFHAAGDACRVRAYTGPSGAPTFERIWTYVPVGTAGEKDFSTDTSLGGGSSSDQVVPTQRAVKNYVDSLVGDPIVIFADGQSNISLTKTFSWSPNPNVQIWNNTQDAVNTGTAFAALSSSTIGIAEKFASDVADANPGRLVYLIKNGYTGQAISHWLSGTGAPDLFANADANLTAALAAISATKIDIYLRWQGEADALSFNTSYVANFATMMSRYWGKSYFPQETPCVIMGIAPASITSGASSDYVNNFLRAIVSADPDKRRFVYTAALSSATYWDSGNIGHGTGQGYFSWGAMAANAFLHGTSRTPNNDPVTNAITAGNPLFTTAPSGASLNTTATITAPISGTLWHGVAADSGGCYIVLDSFNGPANELIGRYAGGTAASLAATPADKLLVGMLGVTYSGSAFNNSGAFQIYSNGLQSVSNFGSYALLFLTPNGSTTAIQAARFDAGGMSYAGSVKSTDPAAGIGYATGAGGAVTQLTNRTTGVTLNKTTGAITTNNTSLAAGATARFTVTDSAVAATDTINLSIKSGTTTDQTDVKVQAVAAGSFDIVVANRHTSTAETGAIVINFNVIKGVTS